MTRPTPGELADFWFPEGEAPDAEEHVRLWTWRVRGGAHAEVVERFAGITDRAAAGELDG